MTIAIPTVYELWDAEAGNLIADYEDESAALLAVRESVNDDGLALWATVALLRVDPDGNRAPIAQGTALLARAMGGPDGTITVGGVVVDAARVQEALFALDMLLNPAFRQAVRDLADVLTRTYSEVVSDLATVRAVAGKLSTTAGVPLRVDAEEDGLALVTPSKALASVLAVGVRRDMPIRDVPDGYAIDIAA